MAAYTIYNKTGESSIAGFKLLDGDFDQVFPTGFEFHPVSGAARTFDGTPYVKKRSSIRECL